MNTKYWSAYFDKQLEKHSDDLVKALNFSNSRLMSQIYEEILTCVDLEKLKSGSRLLDTGCGTGELLTKLISWCAESIELEYFATDISRQMLRKAHDRIFRKFNADDCHCRFEVMSVDNMRYEDGFFDLIIASESLQYTDPYLAIVDILRMTKKGGQVLISVPNQFSPFIKKARERHHGLFTGLDFEKAFNLISPQVSSFFAKPLIFASNQDKKPYLKRKLQLGLNTIDIHQANRFIIYLVK